MTTPRMQHPGNANPLDGFRPDASSVVARDVSGYEVFSHGATGEAHALAHRLTDTHRWGLGHALLGDWLAGHRGHGSDWVHLHFHMAIFELALGEWEQAHRRFIAEVLPSAATGADALTDAPALLWRLEVSAPYPVVLPWEPLRRTALRHLHETPDPFVQLHHLLALAGAGDTGGIDRWLDTGWRPADGARQRTLERFAIAMSYLSKGDFRLAADRLHALLPDLPAIGGSQAQGQLFGQLAAWAARRAGQVHPMSTHRLAA